MIIIIFYLYVSVCHRMLWVNKDGVGCRGIYIKFISITYRNYETCRTLLLGI